MRIRNPQKPVRDYKYARRKETPTLWRGIWIVVVWTEDAGLIR